MSSATFVSGSGCLERLVYLKNSGQFDERQEGLARLLRYRFNWRIREKAAAGSYDWRNARLFESGSGRRHRSNSWRCDFGRRMWRSHVGRADSDARRPAVLRPARHDLRSHHNGGEPERSICEAGVKTVSGREVPREVMETDSDRSTSEQFSNRKTSA